MSGTSNLKPTMIIPHKDKQPTNATFASTLSKQEMKANPVDPLHIQVDISMVDYVSYVKSMQGLRLKPPILQHQRIHLKHNC